MRSKLTIFAITVQMFCGMTLFAFEHKFTGPSMQARHAGQLVSSDEVQAHFELKKGKKNFSLYIYPMDLKPFQNKNFSLSAKLQKKESKVKTPLLVIFNGKFYEISPVQKKGYAVFITVINTVTQKEDLLRFIF